MFPQPLKILAGLELLEEIGELSRLGLSEEELEGYIDFVRDNYPELKEIKDADL